MTRRARVLGGALLALGGCGGQAEELLPAPGHLVLHVDTDAPLPRADGAPRSAWDPTPLFDRLVVEIYVPGAVAPCAGCKRELAIDEDLFRRGASFGVAPESARTGLRARLRLLGVNAIVEGAVDHETTLETVALLPDVPVRGGADATVFLSTDDVGRSIGSLDDPVPALPGAPSASRVGTWLGAQRVDCPAPPGPGEVCVPGGAYWMGHPLSFGDADFIANRQRLVVVSPFYLDAREVTVEEFRGAGVATNETVLAWSGGGTGQIGADFCTYTVLPDPARDVLPLNCVTFIGADRYCEAAGKRLPTEAEFEYVASARESRLYVWGVDDPGCTDAIWGRGVGTPFVSSCADHVEGSLGTPLPASAPGVEPRSRDYLTLPGGTVLDLAGNVAEWSRDVFNTQDEPCWTKPDGSLFIDPLCTTPGVRGEERTNRGGAWLSTAAVLRASKRGSEGTTFALPSIGFRCARSAGD